MKKSTLNANLKEVLSKAASKNPVPAYDTVNREQHPAYSMPPELRLLSILNTSRLEPQFYRTQSELVCELKNLIDTLAEADPYFVAQCIVWSRCCGEGMRSVNHLASVFLAPHISGTDWGKRFFSSFDKKSQTPKGGCIYRLDDMLAIKDMCAAVNDTPLTSAMKKGFASVLVNAGLYELSKYKKTVIDIANLVHPDIRLAKAVITTDSGEEVKAIDAIMRGLTVKAETWEAANSEAGQLVAKAVKDGDISEEDAKQILKEAKNDNWEQLLSEGKLGILAAIRNLRNILQGERESVIDLVAELVKDGDKIRKGKIMPYQLELAQSIVKELHLQGNRKLVAALEEGMTTALPNLKELLTGRNLIMVDVSGSMANRITGQYKGCNSSCIDKAAILAAMIAKGCDADIILFGRHAAYYTYNPNDSLQTISAYIRKQNFGGTNISTAFDLITKEEKWYDRIFLLSDNEANRGCLRSSYRDYLAKGFNPYVYCIDLAGYGTAPLKDRNGMVNFYNGYGYSMLDDLAHLEFSPTAHIDRVREVVI